MVQAKAVDVSKLDDPDQLRNVMVNAERLGRSDVYWQAFNRLCRLEGINEKDPLQRDFHPTLAAYEELLSKKNGRTTRANRTRQKLARKGVVGCLVDWALGSKPTTGFDLLVKNGLAELTAEALVCRYADRFPAHVVQAAEKRLNRQ